MNLPDLIDLFAELPTSLIEERFETLVERPGLKIERIVSLGHASQPGFWYDQPWRECVVLLAGAARLRFEEGELELKPGALVEIAAHRKHRVEWTDPAQPTVWLAVHYPE
jgi:cupin 2 domain-containing protein